MRRRSTLELAERCNYYAEHAQQVVRLALALFDQTRALHGLTDREREWLEYARAACTTSAALISFARHHRHSYYLIKNGDLRGFHPDEIEVIALVARYHRRGTPKQIARGVRRASPPPLRRTVRTLASILRVAESLDRSHAQVDLAASSCGTAATTCSCSSTPAAMPSSRSGPPTGISSRSRSSSASQSASSRHSRDAGSGRAPREVRARRQPRPGDARAAAVVTRI